MLTKVRNQSTREATYVSIGHALIGAGRSSEAIELVEKSSETVQHGYFMTLAGHWAFSEPLDLLNHLDEIPLDSVKREAAEPFSLRVRAECFVPDPISCSQFRLHQQQFDFIDLRNLGKFFANYE